jgi:hypothetical protein
MGLIRTSGIALIAGFVLVILASIVGPNEVYTAPDNDARMEVIRQNQGRWTATNLVWIVASLVTGAGVVLLALGLRESQSPWLLYAGAAAFSLATIAWSVWLYQRTIDPAGNLYTNPPALLSLVFLWATLAALALLGAAFLQGSFPNWPGYMLLAAVGLLLVGLIVAFDAFYASFPPQIFYLLTLIVGIVAMRQ